MTSTSIISSMMDGKATARWNPRDLQPGRALRDLLEHVTPQDGLLPHDRDDLVDRDVDRRLCGE
jgi:hypothetical protein